MGEICWLRSTKKIRNIDKFFEPYVQFLSGMGKSIDEAVSELNRYKDFVKRESRYSAQSKFESTIVEEFIAHLFQKEFGNDTLMYGSVKAYSSLYFSYDSKEDFKKGVDLRINEKDQDVGIYKREVLTLGDNTRREIHIPMVCVECKTYLDKTMYEGVVATADKVKTGNPQCLSLIATESYAVADNVDIALSKIDNIYVLRKQKHAETKRGNINPISATVVKKMLSEVRNHMERKRDSVDELIRTKGSLR